MKRACRTAKCQVGRWRTARACGGTPRRCLCSDRSHTRRHPPQTAPSGPPGPHQDHLGVPAVIFCAISASWLYWAIRTKINCNGLGYQRRRPPNQRMHPPGRTRSAQRAPVGAALKVPIADEDRLVEPDTLGSTIKLTSSASWGSPLAWRRRTTASRRRVLSPIYRVGRRDVPRDPLAPGFWLTDRLPPAVLPGWRRWRAAAESGDAAKEP